MTISASLDQPSYAPGARMVLAVVEDYPKKRTLRVADSTGAVWTKVPGSDTGGGARYTATAGPAHLGANTVTVVLTQVADGKTQTAAARYLVGDQTVRYVGGSLAGDDGGLNLTVDARRVYFGGWPTARAADDAAHRIAVATTRDGGMVWTSYKMSNGTLPSDGLLTSFLSSLSDLLAPRNQIAFVTFEHEPEIKDVTTPEQSHRGYDQLEPLAARLGNLFVVPVQTGFLADGRNKDAGFATWDTYYRDSWDFWGVDHYNHLKQSTNEPLSDPATNWGNVVEYARSKGKPFGIGETGADVGSTPGTVIKTRPDWYAAHRAYALDPANGIVAVCAFDSRETLLDEASARAWYGLG